MTPSPAFQRAVAVKDYLLRKHYRALLLDLDATVVRAYWFARPCFWRAVRRRSASRCVFLDDEDDARFAKACAPFDNRLTRYHWRVATNDAAASAVL